MPMGSTPFVGRPGDPPVVSPFEAAGVFPAEGSWLRSMNGWREQILAWYGRGPRAGEWRSNGEFFDAIARARKNAGIGKEAIISQLRGLVDEGLLEKRIDYDRRVPGRSPFMAMPFVEHRAVVAGGEE